jgi:predicted chitinase
MTTATPVRSSNTPPPPQKTDDSPAAALNFAFPFKKSDGKDFIDEHQFNALLARESGGFFPVSDSGMWHGGIHVTAAGAGASLDLNNGVRCLADGEVVAYRVDRAYPVSELPPLAGKPAVKATYSTGFALVRHTTEFPRGTKLTFFSLYMHLKSFEEYQKDTSLKMPSYWTKVWKVTPFAKDIPKPDVHRGKAAAGQIGLNIRSAPIGRAPISTSVIGILRQGARVQIGAQQGSWGQIASIESGGPVIAATVGSFADPKANTGWIFLGKVHGHQLAEGVLSESHFDQVVVLPKPVKINAGDLIGHLGHYDHLSEPSAGNRMVHIEVFCDDKVKPYIEQGRAWVKKNVWKIEPTILRIDRRVKLYAAMGREGADAPQTGVIQIYPLSALAQGPKENQFEETTAGTDGSKFHWWKVDSADVRRAPITGWVREQNHAGGRVTREAACTWVDFEIHEEAHDPMHTMFATPKAYLDYWLDADEPDVPALAKLSPLAGKVYRSVFTTGSGSHAADELRKASRDPWLQLRLSRLIVKHESEWANPGKWKQLYEWIEQRTGHDPAHEEEQKRIAKLVWWGAVTGKIEGFPESADVFHIHPVGLVGNFFSKIFGKIDVAMLRKVWPSKTVSDAKLQELADELNPNLDAYKLNSSRRLTHFFAQVRQEVGPTFQLQEGLNYQPSALKANFGYFRRNPEEAEIYGRTDAHPADEVEIANRAYNSVTGNRDLGNGDLSSGDGWKFRGRGLKQTTGRFNYTQFNIKYSLVWPGEAIDFVSNPDLLGQMRYAVRAGVFFWLYARLYDEADKTNDENCDSVVDAITRVINRHTDSYAERRNNYKRFISEKSLMVSNDEKIFRCRYLDIYLFVSACMQCL